MDKIQIKGTITGRINIKRPNFKELPREYKWDKQADENYYLHKKYGLVPLNERQYIHCQKKCCIGD